MGNIPKLSNINSECKDHKENRVHSQVGELFQGAIHFLKQEVICTEEEEKSVPNTGSALIFKIINYYYLQAEILTLWTALTFWLLLSLVFLSPGTPQVPFLPV